MHSDRAILSKLLLCFMDLSNEVDETLPSFWNSLFRPVGELELADGSRLTILKTQTDGLIVITASPPPKAVYWYIKMLSVKDLIPDLPDPTNKSLYHPESQEAHVNSHAGTAKPGQGEPTLASVTLNSRKMYWGMLYSAMGSTTKYW